MKVLLVSFSNNYDHQLSLYSLYDDMTAENVDVSTCGIVNPKYGKNFCESNHLFDAPLKPGFSLKMFNLHELKKVEKFIKNSKFDIIYFESLHIWNLYLMLKFRRNIRIIHSIHDVIPHEGRLSSFVFLFNKIIFRYSNNIIVRNKVSYDYCLSKKSIPANKISFLPLGRKWKKYSPCTHSGAVMFFGRISKYKGINNLIEIIKLLPNVEFLVVGKPIEKDDYKLVDQLKKMDNVFVCDEYVSEEKMIDYFQQIDCIILPYNSSTQSGVIVDAYSMSRPCIAFATGGIKNQIIEGETGYLIDEGNDKFADAIKKYLNLLPEKKELMCRNAHSFGEQQYSSKVLAAHFINLLNITKTEKL